MSRLRRFQFVTFGKRHFQRVFWPDDRKSAVEGHQQSFHRYHEVFAFGRSVQIFLCLRNSWDHVAQA
jgi:hypothetical protein